MSGHHHAPVQGNTQSNPVKLAIWIAVGAVALVVGIILVVQLVVASYGSRPMKGNAAMSDAAVAKRLAPVASVAVDPKAPPPAAAPAAAAPAAAAPAAAPAAAAPAAAPANTADAGKSTYDTVCAVCHNAGVAGAPKVGDKAAWATRLKAANGKEGLYTTAIKGKAAMPPKGGNAALSDDAVKAAVDHMLASAK